MIRRRTRPEIVSTRIVATTTTMIAMPAMAIALELQRLLEREPDPAGADHTEHRRGPDVDLEAIQPEGDDLRQHLRQDAPALDLQRSSPGGAYGLDRAGVDPLDDLGGQLAERADRVKADRQRTRDRAEARDGDEDRDRQDDLGKRPDGVEDLPHDVGDDPARDVPGCEEAKWKRDDRADDRPDPGELEGLDHAIDRRGQVAPVRPVLQEHLVEDQRDAAGQVQDLERVHVDGDDGPADKHRCSHERKVALRV